MRPIAGSSLSSTAAAPISAVSLAVSKARAVQSLPLPHGQCVPA
jgi:hypothetical protein